MATKTQSVARPASSNHKNPVPSDRERVFDAFRRWGYLEANLDPLGFMRPRLHPALQLEGPDADRARAIYTASIGIEVNHISDPERVQWIYDRMESEPAAVDQQRALELLIRSDVFEQVLQQRYLGSKRFSLEGTTALIPLVDEVLDTASQQGAIELVMGMSHRGRLNVIALVARRPAQEIFAGFEDVDPRSILGSGDVKYHMGATGNYETRSGRNVHIHLVSNPSHLEAVDPVTEGRTRAKQDRTGPDGPNQYLPLLVHGDAAFAGQGILAETMNYAELPGYTVGGTVHVIVNNLLGFTTNASEEHSTRFAACIARRQSIPIFHVNGEDVDAVLRVARMATQYRYQFKSDVVIDLIGYRRHGHSEVDDPTVTQPLLYKKIKNHPPLWEIYAQRIGASGAQQLVDSIKSEMENAQKAARSLEHKPTMRVLPAYWNQYFGGRHKPGFEVETQIPPSEITQLGQRLVAYPEGFHIHPKVKKLLEQRAEMAQGKRTVDYGMAEALAFASLVKQQVPIRFSGQDVRRGTFNHRHYALLDIENEDVYIPLEHIAEGQARCQVFNSTLSEAGVLGFEYGYSRDYPEALVIWEAQFGDFANVAQAIIDQFISAGEAKWNLLSGVVMLLPHGYEGQGPEHSSARVERYLQLAAGHNIQICQPSTAAQYFHMLRRQALRHWRKPLIVFTPKSMLRHPEACSPLEDFTSHSFLPIVADTTVANPQRIIVCTGKIVHELRAERKKRNDLSTAIVAVEQLYPFPDAELEAEFDRHASARDIVWVQEEPANMGALFNMLPRLRRIAGNRSVLSVKRHANASPATGSAKAHEMEQRALLALAFTTRA